MSTKRAENELIFRNANERLKDRLRALEVDRRLPFVCECSDANCLEAIDITIEAYQAVRADENHFFVLPGHEDEETEVVVERYPEYFVTEK